MKLTGIREQVFVDRYSLKNDKGHPQEKTPDQMWKRVAKGIAEIEKKDLRKYWENYNNYETFRDQKTDYKFVRHRLSSGRYRQTTGRWGNLF